MVKRIKNCHLQCGKKSKCKDWEMECPILKEKTFGFRKVSESIVEMYDYEIPSEEVKVMHEIGTIKPEEVKPVKLKKGKHGDTNSD